MNYRKDIQLLRGIAVLLVVLFHLEIPGFKSGFLGVDVFFVISGYLMAVMYDPTNKIGFFKKRARRLIPAYFVTVVATVLVAAYITSPIDFSQVTRQASFSALFLSNIGFWTENSYFDKSSLKPLLHLWSLGVEIQFYLLVPLIFLVCRKLRWSFPVLLLGSAGLCFLAVSKSPITAFYLLPFRMWEFLIGLGIATYVSDPNTRSANRFRWLGLLGLAAIVAIPFFQLDGNVPSFVHGHPGLTAMLICCSTGLVLAFGLPSSIESNWSATLIERIGTFSYSIYLAHFPVIVLILYRPFSGTVLKADSLSQGLMTGVAVIVAAMLLYYLVEQPFRHSKRSFSIGIGGAVVIFAVSAAGSVYQQHTTPPSEIRIYSAWFDRAEFRCGKFYSLLHRKDVTCDLTPDLLHPSQRVLFIGNSHADAIKKAFVSVARSRNIGVFFVVQNDPLMNGGRVGVNDLVRDAKEKKANAVVLHFSPGAVDPATIEELANKLSIQGIPVSYILPIPVWHQSVLALLLRSISGGESVPRETIDDYVKRNRKFIDQLEKINTPGFKTVATVELFCHPVCDAVAEDGRPLYFDDAHLTLTGGERMLPAIERALQPNVGLPAPILATSGR
ncbi:acyltransferase family protein [Massilia sp.]|uniref:acyltransferase family protein n=1 Tax=Massilia sp. TaxID=1882437 RepID=UPI00352BEC32